MSDSQASIKQPSLFKGTEWDTNEPSIGLGRDPKALDREETFLAYSQAGNWLWFYHLITFRYRMQLAQNWNNFTSVKLTATRKGLRVSFIRERAEGGLEMAFFTLNPIRPEIEQIRDAFKKGRLDWKKLKF